MEKPIPFSQSHTGAPSQPHAPARRSITRPPITRPPTQSASQPTNHISSLPCSQLSEAGWPFSHPSSWTNINSHPAGQLTVHTDSQPYSYPDRRRTPTSTSVPPHHLGLIRPYVGARLSDNVVVLTTIRVLLSAPGVGGRRDGDHGRERKWRGGEGDMHVK